MTQNILSLIDRIIPQEWWVQTLVTKEHAVWCGVGSAEAAIVFHTLEIITSSQV